MNAALLPWLAAILVLLGLTVITLAVLGMLRLQQFRLRLHAGSMVSVMGVLPLLLVALLTGDAALSARAILIIGFLLLTTSASLHALACADASSERELQNRK